MLHDRYFRGNCILNTLGLLGLGFIMRDMKKVSSLPCDRPRILASSASSDALSRLPVSHYVVRGPAIASVCSSETKSDLPIRFCLGAATARYTLLADDDSIQAYKKLAGPRGVCVFITAGPSTKRVIS
jgi:hypothetical protein